MNSAGIIYIRLRVTENIFRWLRWTLFACGLTLGSTASFPAYGSSGIGDIIIAIGDGIAWVIRGTKTGADPSAVLLKQQREMIRRLLVGAVAHEALLQKVLRSDETLIQALANGEILVKGLHHQVDVLAQAMHAQMEKIDDLPAKFREDVQSLMNQNRERRLKGVVSAIDQYIELKHIGQEPLADVRGHWNNFLELKHAVLEHHRGENSLTGLMVPWLYAFEERFWDLAGFSLEIKNVHRQPYADRLRFDLNPSNPASLVSRARHFFEQTKNSDANVSHRYKNLATLYSEAARTLGTLEHHILGKMAGIESERVLDFTRRAKSRKVAISDIYMQVLEWTDDGTLVLWDLDTGRALWNVWYPHEVNELAFSRDGTTVSIASKDGQFEILDASQGATIGRLDTPAARSAKFSMIEGISQHGSQGVLYLWPNKFMDVDRMIFGWNAQNRLVEERDIIRVSHAMDHVTLGDEGQVLIMAKDGYWNYDYSKHDYSVGPSELVVAYKELPNTPRRFGSSRHEDLEVTSGTGAVYVVYSMSAHDGTITDLRSSADGRFAITASLGTFFRNGWREKADCTIKLWDLERQMAVSVLQLGPAVPRLRPKGFMNNTSRVSPSIAKLSPNARFIAAASSVCTERGVYENMHRNPRRVRAWEVGKGEEIRINGLTNVIMSEVSTLSVSSKGVLVTDQDNGRVISWDLKTGEVQRFVGHGSAVRSAAVSTNGKVLFTGGNDGSLRVWSLESADEVRVIDLFQPTAFDVRAGSPSKERLEVVAVAISEDGLQGISGHRDGSVILWNLTTGDALGQYLVPDFPLWNPWMNLRWRETFAIIRYGDGLVTWSPEKGGAVHAGGFDGRFAFSESGNHIINYTVSETDSGFSLDIYSWNTTIGRGHQRRTLRTESDEFTIIPLEDEKRILIFETEPMGTSIGVRFYDLALGRELIRYTIDDVSFLSGTVRVHGNGRYAVWIEEYSKPDSRTNSWGARESRPSKVTYRMRYLDLESGELIRTTRIGREPRVAVSFSNGDNLLIGYR